MKQGPFSRDETFPYNAPMIVTTSCIRVNLAIVFIPLLGAWIPCLGDNEVRVTRLLAGSYRP